MNAADALVASLGIRAPIGRSRKTVFLQGAGARLGETILAALLADHDVASVQVETTARLPSSISKLTFTSLHADTAAAIDFAADVAVLVVGELGDTALGWRSVYGRDVVFTALPIASLPATLESLSARGVRHLVLVSPTEYHLQPAGFDGLAHGSLGLLMLRLFDRAVLLRPGTAGRAPVTGKRSIGAALGRFILDNLKFMLPARRTSIDAKRCARLVVAAVHNATPGVTVLDAAALIEPDVAAARFTERPLEPS